ncbi:hypothetical protein [Mycobacterium sp. E2479]|uniref:hypothetical protein n=1 Tax=Mycobacterium sp. E2479 TaxID=1834134 RepID=UPI000AAE5FD0|nr:hypothetical protein [Mycobacterium sp. E2479]
MLRRVRFVHGWCRFFLRLLLHGRLLHGRRWRFLNRSGSGVLHGRLMHGRRWRFLNRSRSGVLHGRWRLYWWRLNGLLRTREQTAAGRPTAAEGATAKPATARPVAGLRRIRCLRVR